MNSVVRICCALGILTAQAYAQDVEVRYDDNTFAGVLQTAQLAPLTEESVILRPDGPCTVKEIRLYLSGTAGARDTIWITGDASSGAVPPTQWVWHYNTLVNPYIVTYSEPGWYTIDVRDANLRCDGYDGIVIQHRIKPNNILFGLDGTQQTAPYHSFVMQPQAQNPFGGAFSLAPRDYLVRLLVEYDHPSGTSSQPPPAPKFVDITHDAGVVTGEGGYIGSGRISVADWNNDGFDDIAFGSRFFRNNGNGTFSDVSSTVGVQMSSCTWGDYDNDGYIDMFAVNGWGNDRIYRNNGDGTFSDVTAQTGFVNDAPTVMPIWFDYNHDGYSDLFIANGRKEETSGETYYQDRLWKNNGDGTFSDVTQEAKIHLGEPSPYDDCWGASPCDYNHDGWTDIFVASYRLRPDRLFRNNGDGTFTEVGAQTGVRGVPTYAPEYFGHGIGADWGDYNNDGRVDLVVGNLGHPDVRGLYSNPSLVFENKGGAEPTFEEKHRALGVRFLEMNAGVLWADFNLDGALVLWHCQYAYRPAGKEGEPQRLSRLYINRGEPDYTFSDETWTYGPVIHGAWTAARLDIDNDGRVDLAVASPHDGLRLYRNTMEREGRWLALRLKGNPAAGVPLDGYGTSVRAYAGGNLFYRDLQGGGSGATGTQHSNTLYFGLGDVDVVDSVVITYPNQVVTRLVTVVPDRLYTVTYGVTDVADAQPGPEAGFVVDAATIDGAVCSIDLSTTVPLSELTTELVDQLGRRIAAGRWDNVSSGRYSFALPSTMAGGLYILRCSDGDGVVLRKLIHVR